MIRPVLTPPTPRRRRGAAPATPWLSPQLSVAAPEAVEGAAVHLEGTVQRVRFASPDGRFQVVLVADAAGALTPVSSARLALEPGERVRIDGTWRAYRGELQVLADRVERVLPSTREGVAAWLGSGGIKGVGPALAARIVARFGDDTTDVLQNHPERLHDVPGVGAARAERIAEVWRARAADRETTIWLQSQGIAPRLAARVQRHYGARTVPVLKHDPYQLARDVHGIGFRIADRVAAALGIVGADPRRLRAGVEHALYEAAGEGHAYLPRAVALEHAARILEVSVDAVAGVIEALVSSRRVVVDPIVTHVAGPRDDDALYSHRVFVTEQTLADSLAALASAPCALRPLGAPDLAQIDAALPFALDPTQRQALSTTFGSGVAVLTGGPGTGKTTIVRAIVLAALAAGHRVELASPTGRAARRLAQSTGREARTIHRLLEVDPRTQHFGRNAENPVEADLVVIDEASMLDLELAAALTAAVRPGSSLLLVGDVEQLPAVGIGDVLRDLIGSAVVPVARLTRIFRQQRGSRIVDCAHAILEGRLLEGDRDGQGEFFFVRTDTPQQAVETTVRAVCERLPAAFGLDPVRDVQVLVPMHSGQVGTQALNAALQAVLGGRGPSVEHRDVRFAVGDKVMQRRNNYDAEVFNGDIGFVLDVDPDRASLVVDFDGRHVAYAGEDLDQVELAYAITVHKSQGSEFRAVVVVVTTHHFKLLQRNLLYTAVTRARERLLVVGMPRAAQMAIDDVATQPRFSRLAWRLRQSQR